MLFLRRRPIDYHAAKMADPMVLYVVTGLVALGLFTWVGVVLATAPDGRRLEVPPSGRPAVSVGVVARVAAPRIIEDAGRESSPVVVNLPPIRSRLDSHPEIQDGPPVPAGVEIVDDDAPVSGHPFVLVTAVGRNEPGAEGRSEEAFAIVDRHHLFVLADGAGGQKVGGVASQLAVETITASFDSDSPSRFPDDRALSRRANRLRRAVLEANRKIVRRSGDIEAYEGMGTRVVAAYFSPNNRQVHVGQVGDCPCFRVRAGRIARLTSSRQSSLGTREAVDVDISVESAEGGDVYLLCSHGLARALAEADLLRCVSSSASLEAATTMLVDRAKGHTSNVTAILIRVDSPPSG